MDGPYSRHFTIECVTASIDIGLTKILSYPSFEMWLDFMVPNKLFEICTADFDLNLFFQIVRELSI